MASADPLAAPSSPTPEPPLARRRRRPDAGELRLITIPISHYCEKARWALERAGLRYSEERHIQVVHRFASRRAGGSGTVPVLVTGEGAIGDSADIIAWVDRRTPASQRLLAEDAAGRRAEQELCRRFDEQLGPAGRRLLYVRMFAAPRQLLLAFNDQGVPAWEDRALRAGLPVMKAVVAALLGIRPGVEVADEARVWHEFDHAAELLRDGRPYLLGERFGVADLTFAALSAPLLMPSAYGVPLPRLQQLDAPTAALVQSARDHPAGRFALRVIAQHRGRAG